MAAFLYYMRVPANRRRRDYAVPEGVTRDDVDKHAPYGDVREERGKLIANLTRGDAHELEERFGKPFVEC